MNEVHPAMPLDPDDWERHAVLRESFLCLRLGPAAAAAFREASWTVYLAVLQLGQEPPGLGVLDGALWGAARDLRQLQGFLQALGAGSELPVAAVELQELARDVATGAAALAARLEAVVANRSRAT